MSYPQAMMESVKKVEATRPERLAQAKAGEHFPRLGAGDIDQLLRSFHPDYRKGTKRELAVGAGKGAVVYLRQEGRGIGLTNKLHAYKLQEQGLDTVEANEALGLPADRRDYGIGSQILRDLGLRRLRVLTNNPRKIYGLEAYGLTIVERVPVHIEPNDDNRRYLKTKADKLGHMLEGL